MSMWMMRRHRVWAVTEQLRCHEIMELFQRLAEGHAARITVVTPNRRLAQALTAEFDAFQIGKGLSVWEAPDILPFGAFVERLWEDALYSELGDKLPLLLTPQQELLLWEQILEGNDLLILPQAAAQCRDAWGLLHQWRVGAARGNEDHSAFSEWAKQYEKETLGDVDAARLAVAVPRLETRRKEVVRVFSRVTRPGHHLPGAQKAPLPFNVSLGEPLSNYALVDAALGLLELSFHSVEFERTSKLLRSPF